MLGKAKLMEAVMRERTIYLRLLREVEMAHEALDKVDRRIHQLLDEMDAEWARDHIAQLKKEDKLP